MCKKLCHVCGRETGNHAPVCKHCGAELHDPEFRDAHAKTAQCSRDGEPLREHPVKAPAQTQAK